MKKIKKTEKRKGFTLIELLATILIVSLVLGISGYFIMNTINSAKNRSAILAENSIKKSASIYTEEYPNDVIWINNQDNKYVCISVKSLVDKGYIKTSDVDDDTLSKYVIVTKNESDTIISTEYDTINQNGNYTICGGSANTTKIAIPTAKKYCNNNTYNGLEQNLIKENVKGLTFTGNIKGKDAGSYKVTVQLQDGYVWKDNTSDDKTITCSIKKTLPSFYGDKNGEDGKDLNDTIVNLTSNVAGTLTVKISNKEVANATLSSKEINVNKVVELTIKKFSTKQSATYITVTLKPNDNNYKQTSFVYTIANVTKNKVNTALVSSMCKNLYYNGTNQTLIETAEDGYTLYNTTATEIGKHNVMAKLKYGYTWKDGTTDDKTIICEIKTPTPEVTYDNNGGSGCSSKIVTYNDAYGALCTPKKTGYTFNGWYLSKSSNTKIETNTKVTNFNNHTVYAKWTANIYTVKFNGNGSTSGSTGDKECTYDKDCTLTSNGFKKAGYAFNGWNIKKDGTGTNYTNNQSVKNLTTSNSITLYARWKKTDNTPPTCGSQSPTVTDWTSGNRTITIKCTDTGGAGCVKDTYSKTYNESGKEVKTDTITIKDKVGNTTKCKITVKVDKKAPEIILNKLVDYKYGDNGYKYCDDRKSTRYSRVALINYYDYGSGLKNANVTYPSAYSLNPTAVHTRDLNGSTEMEGAALCGDKGMYKYKFCDIVGNCTEGTYDLS